MNNKGNIKSRLLKGGSWALFGKIVGAITGITVNALLARLLTPSEFGIYLLLFSLALFGGVMAQLGMKQAALRLIAESIALNRNSNISIIVRRTFSFALLGGVAITIIWLFGLDSWLSNYIFPVLIDTNVLYIVPLWACVVSFKLVLVESFRGLGDIRLSVLFDTVFSNIILVVILIFTSLLSIDVTLDKILPIIFIAYLLSFITGMCLLFYKIKSHDSIVKSDSCDNLLEIAKSMYVIDLSVFLLGQSMIWIVGYFESAEQVGLFGASQRIVNLVAMPLLIVNLVVPPIIAELNINGEKNRLQKMLRVTAAATGIPAVLVLCLFIFKGDFVLSSVFGSHYANGKDVLMILSIGTLANVWAGSCGKVLLMTGHQRTMMYITLTSGMLSVILGVVLVQMHGIIGAAYATALAKIAQNIMALLATKHLCGIWTHIPIFYFINRNT